MARTRPGVERIARQRLQAQHASAARQLAAHAAQCLTCKRAGTNLHGRCDTWWQLARTEHRTARQLRQYARPETSNMTPLFTEDECDIPPF